jgi:hypothetical protein
MGAFAQADAKISSARAQPKLHVSRLAARTRKVSGPKMFRNPMRIRPTFQWFFQNDVCKFESYMPSQAVASLRGMSGLAIQAHPFISQRP